MIQCGSVDLHGRPAMLDGTGLLPPTVSFHVHWQEMHSPVQQLHLDPASTGRPSEIFLSMKQLDSVQCNKILKKKNTTKITKTTPQNLQKNTTKRNQTGFKVRKTTLNTVHYRKIKGSFRNIECQPYMVCHRIRKRRPN